jgi:hypothetical protein
VAYYPEDAQKQTKKAITEKNNCSKAANTIHTKHMPNIIVIN